MKLPEKLSGNIKLDGSRDYQEQMNDIFILYIDKILRYLEERDAHKPFQMRCASCFQYGHNALSEKCPNHPSQEQPKEKGCKHVWGWAKEDEVRLCVKCGVLDSKPELNVEERRQPAVVMFNNEPWLAVNKEDKKINIIRDGKHFTFTLPD